MAIAAVPLLAGGGTAAAGTAAVATAATAAATAAAATWSTGALVAATALGGAIMIGSMTSGGDDSTPRGEVEPIDTTAVDELTEEKERNKNLRRKLYSNQNLLGTEDEESGTEELTLLGA